MEKDRSRSSAKKQESHRIEVGHEDEEEWEVPSSSCSTRIQSSPRSRFLR